MSLIVSHALSSPNISIISPIILTIVLKLYTVDLINWNFICIIFGMKKVTEYPKVGEERQLKNLGQRQPQRTYDSLKGRHDNNPRDTDHRKHNSPDYNRYRQGN
jgi:hypothetical protein